MMSFWKDSLKVLGLFMTGLCLTIVREIRVWIPPRFLVQDIYSLTGMMKIRGSKVLWEIDRTFPGRSVWT